MQLFGYEVLPAADVAQLRESLEREQLAAHQLSAARDAAEGKARDAAARTTSAEAMVRLQAGTIERLMASNDRMVGLVADMRRVGFGILEPIEVNDRPTTIDEADREAVEADDELAADDDQ